MAIGDGVADIFGRRWGQTKWFFSRDKSYAGSLAFVLFAFAGSALLTAYLAYFGELPPLYLLYLLYTPFFFLLSLHLLYCFYHNVSFHLAGCFEFSVAESLPTLLLISILCAATELVPIGDDNITVPLVAALLSWQLLTH